MNLKKHRPDWVLKTITGSVLGFTLALSLSGIFAWCGPGGIDAEDKSQFVMWIIAPLWMSLLGSVFWFRTGLRALLWLGGANGIAYLALILAKGQC